MELAYIKPKNQRYIAVAIEGQQSAPSLSQAQRMRELDQKGVLNGDVIDGIMMEDLPLFINDAIPEEHKNGIDMRRDMLRRSHVLVVCGDEVDEDVKNDIAVAKRLNITATTLDGILTVNQQGRHDV